jgi:ribosome biogenesis GTPase
MLGWVYKSTGSWYIVKNDQGHVYHARIKGKLKIDDISSTNPVAVGDRVMLDLESGEESATIKEVVKRNNYINRVSPHNKHQHHIIASNIDQSLLFVTLRQPKTSFGFIDRFLVTGEAYHVPSIIVFNKLDIYGAKEMALLDLAKSIYEPIGYKLLSVSIKENKGLEEVKNILKGKTSLLSGHSGVGKSTFINHVFPELDLRTNEVSGWSGKGLHTTTFAEMYDLPFGGRIIDTPGIREMGLVDMKRGELSHYFPEMRELIHDCQFNDCSHREEPGCAIKKAVVSGKIHEERFLSYLSIYDSLDEKPYG